MSLEGSDHGADQDRSINVLAFIRGKERYVFLYDNEGPDELLKVLGQYAADPELSFTWYDAAVMSQRIAKLRSDGVFDKTKQLFERPPDLNH